MSELPSHFEGEISFFEEDEQPEMDPLRGRYFVSRTKIIPSVGKVYMSCTDPSDVFMLPDDAENLVCLVLEENGARILPYTSVFGNGYYQVCVNIEDAEADVIKTTLYTVPYTQSPYALTPYALRMNQDAKQFDVNDPDFYSAIDWNVSFEGFELPGIDVFVKPDPKILNRIRGRFEPQNSS